MVSHVKWWYVGTHTSSLHVSTLVVFQSMNLFLHNVAVCIYVHVSGLMGKLILRTNVREAAPWQDENTTFPFTVIIMFLLTRNKTHNPGLLQNVL